VAELRCPWRTTGPSAIVAICHAADGSSQTSLFKAVKNKEHSL
jgi:hypothetical protein